MLKPDFKLTFRALGPRAEAQRQESDQQSETYTKEYRSWVGDRGFVLDRKRRPGEWPRLSTDLLKRMTLGEAVHDVLYLAKLVGHPKDWLGPSDLNACNSVSGSFKLTCSKGKKKEPPGVQEERAHNL